MNAHELILNWVDPKGIAESLWLIIALPLLGALINGLFGRQLGRGNVNFIATAAVAGSFALSLITFWVINNGTVFAMSAFGDKVPFAVGQDYGTWFAAGDFRVNFGLFVDHLSGSLLLVITGVGMLIHIYATSYMEHDEGYWRFFAYLNLFIAMMLTLVMADNLVLLFVGWEGVGMCSYLLIGFWYRNPAYATAGKKAFITNRIGDFGFLAASFLMVMMIGAFVKQAPTDNLKARGGSISTFDRGLKAAGPLSFSALSELARSVPVSQDRLRGGQGPNTLTLKTDIDNGPLKGKSYGGVLTAALLLFLLGAAGKSAQIPLYVWLPDAMAGPTPVSALIHAATMVTAGVYLFSRMSFLLVLSPTAMITVAMIGASTALLAALIAFSQDDIKKVLAYSTVSQLGLMFLAVGVGAFWTAVFHLITHAFFKACLFLGAGSVMHGNADETDIKKLGGVRKEMPVTHLTFLIATLAITGLAPLSGFFSKDAILHAAQLNEILGYGGLQKLAWAMGTLTALCTAFYMFRVYILTFWGTRNPNARIPHAHESALRMTSVLVILAVLSVVASLYMFPLLPGTHEPVLENFLRPVFMHTEDILKVAGTVKMAEHPGSFLSTWIGAWAVAWMIAIAGSGAAIFLYTQFFPRRVGQRAPAPLHAIRRFSQNKFYVDELYELLIIRPIKFISFIFYKVIDSLLIDTVAVRGTAWVTTRLGSALRYLQSGDVQSYAAIMALAAAAGLVWTLLKVMP